MNADQKIRELITKYREAETRRDGRLDQYRTEDGDDIRQDSYRQYDEARFDGALDAEGDLDSLLSELEALTGPEPAISTNWVC